MSDAHGPIQIEIFEAATLDDYPNSSLRIDRVFSVGTVNDGVIDNRATFKITQQQANQAYSCPVLARGLGPSLNNSWKVTDPFINVTINNLTGYNDNWTQSQSGIIQATNYAPSSALEAAYFGQTYTQNNVVTLQDKSGSFIRGKGGIDLIAISGNATGSIFNESQFILSGGQSAWISYDVSSGMNSRRVFAYALSILDRISGSTGLSLNTVNNPGISIQYTGENRQGYCTNFDLFLGDTGSCKSPTENPLIDPNEPTEICLPTGLSSGALSLAITQAIDAIRASYARQGVREAATDAEINSLTTASNYKVYNGYILLDRPISGDSITFNSYNLPNGYTGQYNNDYGVNPPYDEVSFTWTYPNDFTGTSDLTNLINNNLFVSGYNLWHVFNSCVDTNRSGYFESGPLLKATYINSGKILIESQRVNNAGNFLFTISSGTRLAQKEALNFSKYMLPNTVTFQGANTYGNWNNLDTRSDIDWLSIPPVTTILNFSKDITGVSGNAVRPPQNTDTVDSVSGSLKKQFVYEANIQGKDLCGRPYSSNVEFYIVDTGLGMKASCSDEDLETDEEELESLAGVNVNNLTGSSFGNMYFLQTGWKFNNENEYNYYRVLLSDFRSETRAKNQSLSNEFYVSSVSLFGYESGVVLQSGSMCLIGARYTGQIQGLTTGIITGTATRLATIASNGEVIFRDFPITGAPNNGGMVRFQNQSGTPTTPFTGLLNASLSGTGFYTEVIGGYFYESGVTGVSFVKNVSGFITGSGNLIGGPYAILNDGFIDSLTGTQYVTGRSTGLASGIIPSFTYLYQNIPAFGYSSGSIGGMATDGYFSVSGGITTSLITAYGFDITGTRNAGVDLTYNTPTNGNTIFLNGIPIIYSNSAVLTPPTYYKTINELTNIINSGSGQFAVTGYNNGTKIFLKATDLGISGNGITVISTGLSSPPTFSNAQTTGGLTHYRQITPTGFFTGYLDETKGATGFFTSVGTGNITGTIKQLNFIREFTGVWNLTTGAESFRDNAWISGHQYTNNGIITPFQYNLTPNNIDISVSYINDPPVFTTDLVTLLITGYNFSTGLSIQLTGKL